MPGLPIVLSGYKMNSSDIVAVTSRSFCKNEYLIKKLKEKYSKILLNETGRTLQDEDLLSFLGSADKAIIGIEKISNDLLQKLPNLKVISKYGVGLDNLDSEAIKDQKIKIGFTPGVNKQSVAELALTLALMSLRRIHSNHSEIISGHWSQEKGSELYGKTIGLLGFGNIGQKFAALLQPFNCKFLFFDEKFFNPNELLSLCHNIRAHKESVQQLELIDVLKQAEIISMHLPLSKSTENIITSKEMQYLDPSVSIINTARGGLINEQDLYNFLIANPQAFAAFDVYKDEPAINNPLFELPNFFGTSHRSSLTHEGINAMGLAAIDGLDNNRLFS